MTGPDDRAIRDCLDAIHDPCSIAAGRPTGLDSMGLVVGWHYAEGTLAVTLRTTWPGCTMAPHFVKRAEEALATLDGVRHVVVEIDHASTWSDAMIRPTAPAAGPSRATTRPPVPWAMRA